MQPKGSSVYLLLLCLLVCLLQLLLKNPAGIFELLCFSLHVDNTGVVSDYHASLKH